MTVVVPWAVADFLGARDRAEATAHLRELRDRGLLIHSKGRLTQRMRRGFRGPERCYVFRRRASEVPKVRRERRPADPDQPGRALRPIAI